MEKPRLIKRIIIEYTEEEASDAFSSRYRIHKKTVEEHYLQGKEHAFSDKPLISTRSEYIV